MKRTNLFSGIAAALLVAGAAFPLLTAAAEVPDTAYEILVVANRAEGDLILKGKYQQAIDRIARQPNVFKFATANNLCVAHVMLQQFDAAKPYCDEAVELAENTVHSARWKGEEEMTKKWAHAYSNHGVFHVSNGDIMAAEQDFQMAANIGADMHAATHNLARLHLDTGEPVAVAIRQ